MTKTWTIVIFTDEDTVEAVPSTWIIDNKCYWPSFTFEKLTAAIKNHEKPNTCWPSYPIRIIRNGTFANFSKATEKCSKAQNFSDVHSDVSSWSPSTKKRKVIRKTYGSAFEENNSSSSDDNNNYNNLSKSNNKNLSKLPSPPHLTNEVSIKTMKKKSTDKTNIDNINTSPSTSKELSRNLSTLYDLKDKEDLNGTDQSFTGECKCLVHLKHCEKYFKEIIRQQNILKANMWQYTDALQELTTSINHLVTNNKVNQVQETTSFLTIFYFPVQTEEDLTRVDGYLNTEKNFNAAMNELSKIGGSSIYNFIQRALQMLITNNLAATYSWLGRRAKKIFNKLKLADLIIGSAKKSISNATNKDCEEAIKKWLRRAKERSNNNKINHGENIEENLVRDENIDD
ncbi:homeobox-like protein HDP1 [Linepithema humile]|uniref:homeobox-like protein HDP1 n=1 Tax=Linepithema humile TaxID=83485 RepID=UPI00351E1C72